MKRYVFVAIVAFLGLAVGGVAADAGPLADAGLDQEVGTNTTVQLDGTGSAHPDGTINGYEWSIETPAGARTTPACADCGRTSFRPTELGRYNVTVVVTDSEGRSSTDTLYVYVRDFGPTVRLDGDTDPQAGERAPYEATVEANGSDLEELTWLIDGEAVATDALSGSEATEERSIGFSGSGSYRLTVVANDTTGRSGRDTLVVDPRDVSSSGPSFDDTDRSDPVSPKEPSGRPGCKNGVYVEGDAGCIGHISGPSHTNQDEGCREAFCGVENPTSDSDIIDEVSDDNNQNGDEIGNYNNDNLFDDFSESLEDSESTSITAESVDGRNADAGYIGI